ncbi:AraC family transcriptional regulator [Rhodoferax saidenbachensis]|uniref:AraC family transcriptional regulator n=1 Tax=Rhodoferax saidenbachensis TaxID=1484693 RepID=A0ABU1ZNX0_9BURK|nr:AraC family transcriptional regulator [Rhodoferax saidenbachensis]MDR7307250.1 AraC family transcriptional regulator [Rhodoferax saidenbachensis]
MNRSHSWTDYQDRLSRVTAYIHDHLAEDLGLDQLAEVAHLSPYHWHRVYHALNGETIAATIRRLRLHRASGYLANTQLLVAQVARKCGYPNVQSFTRAFGAAYGMGPTQYRAQGGHVVFRQGLAQAAAAGYAVDIRFVPAVPEAQLRSWAGLSVPADASAAAPLQPMTLGGCTCAVLRHRGPYATMGAAYQWLYGQWLVQSGHAALDQPVFEEYLNNPRDTAPADLLTDIYLPLQDSA